MVTMTWTGSGKIGPRKILFGFSWSMVITSASRDATMPERFALCHEAKPVDFSSANGGKSRDWCATMTWKIPAKVVLCEQAAAVCIPHRVLLEVRARGIHISCRRNRSSIPVAKKKKSRQIAESKGDSHGVDHARLFSYNRRMAQMPSAGKPAA